MKWKAEEAATVIGNQKKAETAPPKSDKPLGVMKHWICDKQYTTRYMTQYLFFERILRKLDDMRISHRCSQLYKRDGFS